MSYANNSNEIVLKKMSDGQRIEGIISGTPKPGTFMQVKAATEPVGGRLTYEVYAPGTGDGTPRQLLLLDIDDEQGKTADDAYVTGTRGFLHICLPGDEVRVRKADITGTGSAREDLAIGDRLLIVDGTGKAAKVAVGVANASAVYPLVSQQTLVDQPAETLVHVRISGF